MPNKRFLGLGFTFTATDKGLEKKLTSVSSLLTDISDELDTVNKKFKSFESLLKDAEMPKMKAMPTQKARPKARKEVQEPRRKTIPTPRKMVEPPKKKTIPSQRKMVEPRRKKVPTQTKRKTRESTPVDVMNFDELRSASFMAPSSDPIPVQVINFKDLAKMGFVTSTPVQSLMPEKTSEPSGIFIDKSLEQVKLLGKESQDFFAAITKELKGNLSNSFGEMIHDVELFKDEFGELTVDSKKKLRDLAIQQSKTVSFFSADFHKRLGKLDLAFTKTTEYLGDVKDSLGELAGSFGIHLKELIPPQFMAFGKLLKTILGAPLKGLFKGVKSIVMKPFTRKKSEAETSMTKALRKLNVYGQKQVSVVTQTGKATKNLFTTSRKSEGILGQISDTLRGSAHTLTELLDTTNKSSSKLGGASVGRGKKNIYNALVGIDENLKKPTEGEGMSLFKKIMIGATLLGVAIGIVIAKWDDIKAWFEKIGPVLKDAVSSIGQWAKDMAGKALDMVGKAFSSVGDYIAKAFQGAIDSVASSLRDLGPKLFSGMLHPLDSLEKKSGEFKDKIFDTVTGLFGKKKIEVPSPTPMSPDKPKLEGPPAGNRVQDLRDNMAMKQQTDSLKSSESQLALMQQNNSLMNQMLSTMQKQPANGGANVSVKIGSDARKQGFNLQQQELLAHGLAGQ